MIYGGIEIIIMKNRYLYQLICICGEKVYNQKSTCFGKLFHNYQYYVNKDYVDFLSLRVLYYGETGEISVIDTVLEQYYG